MKRRRREDKHETRLTELTAEALCHSAILVTLAAELARAGGTPSDRLVATVVEHMAPITADIDLTQMVLLNLAGRVAQDVAEEAHRKGMTFADLWASEALRISEALS